MLSSLAILAGIGFVMWSMAVALDAGKTGDRADAAFATVLLVIGVALIFAGAR